jgi:hypothetical protein
MQKLIFTYQTELSSNGFPIIYLDSATSNSPCHCSEVE